MALTYSKSDDLVTATCDFGTDDPNCTQRVTFSRGSLGRMACHLHLERVLRWAIVTMGIDYCDGTPSEHTQQLACEHCNKRMTRQFRDQRFDAWYKENVTDKIAYKKMLTNERQRIERATGIRRPHSKRQSA